MNFLVDVISGSLPDQLAVEKMHRLAYLVRLSREEAIATLSSVCVKYSLQQALAFTRYVSPPRTNKQNYPTIFIQYLKRISKPINLALN